MEIKDERENNMRFCTPLLFLNSRSLIVPRSKPHNTLHASLRMPLAKLTAMARRLRSNGYFSKRCRKDILFASFIFKRLKYYGQPNPCMGFGMHGGGKLESVGGASPGTTGMNSLHNPGSFPFGSNPIAMRQELSSSATALIG